MLGFKRIWKILKITKVDKFLTGFILFVLAVCVVIQMVEPQIDTYGEAIWYAYVVITTTGFGDYVAVTTIGRICTMLIGLYGIFIVALIPGVVVSYYLDFVNTKAEQTMGNFLEKLENLEHLSKEELQQISEKVKNSKFGSKNKR